MLRKHCVYYDIIIDFNAHLNWLVHSKKCWVVLTQLWVKYELTQPLG